MTERSEVKIGLIPCPNLPEKLAYKMQELLPDRLSEKISDSIDYTIEIDMDPLVGAAEDAKHLMRQTEKVKNRKQWDFAVGLTDLPLFDGKDLVLADADYKKGIGQISVPAFGSFPFPFQVKKVVVQMMKELFEHIFESIGNGRSATSTEDSMSENRKVQVTKQFPFSFIRRYRFNSEGKKLDLHLIIRPRITARLKILFGMTFANRPSLIIPSFKPVVAVAFATGAYGLIFPTLWTLSGAFEPYRFFGLMLGAIFSIIVWIIVSNQLWERPMANTNKKIRRLYNNVTVVTLTVAVLCYYAALYVLFLLTTLLFVPPEQFASLGDWMKALTSRTILNWLGLPRRLLHLPVRLGQGWKIRKRCRTLCMDTDKIYERRSISPIKMIKRKINNERYVFSCLIAGKMRRTDRRFSYE